LDIAGGAVDGRLLERVVLADQQTQTATPICGWQVGGGIGRLIGA
jgi:hypothetical protein